MAWRIDSMFVPVLTSFSPRRGKSANAAFRGCPADDGVTASSTLQRSERSWRPLARVAAVHAIGLAAVLLATVAAHAWGAHLRTATGTSFGAAPTIAWESVWLWTGIGMAAYLIAVVVTVLDERIARRRTAARLTLHGAP